MCIDRIFACVCVSMSCSVYVIHVVYFACVYAYTNTYIPTYMHTIYIPVHTLHAYIYTYIQAYIHAASGKWGRHYFEVHINSLDCSAGSTCCVGFDVRRPSLETSPVAGIVYMCTNSRVYIYIYIWLHARELL
jgi:hypothetical protein